MTRRACLAVMLVLAVAPAASAAQRRPRFYHLGVGWGPALTDGKSDVAIPTSLYSAVFYSFKTQPPTQTLMNSPSCVEPPDYPYPSTLDSIGEGKILWNCASVAEGPLLEDVDAKAVFQIPQPPTALFGYAEDAFNGTLGSSWIGMWLDDHGVSYPGYYSRDTGEWRREPMSAHRYPNVDAPALAETLCRPLTRVPTPPDLSDVDAAPFEPYFYERPYGVTTPESTVNGVTYQRITVQRCGSHKRSIVARCKWLCPAIQFSAGLITWVDGRALRAYVPRTGARYTWPAATLPAEGFSIHFAHTRQRLIASTPSRTSAQQWDIWAARMPKR